MSLEKFVKINDAKDISDYFNKKNTRYIVSCVIDTEGYDYNGNWVDILYSNKFIFVVDDLNDIPSKVLSAASINKNSFRFDYERNISFQITGPNNSTSINIGFEFIFDRAENKFVKYSGKNITKSAAWKKIIKEREDMINDLKKKYNEHINNINNTKRTVTTEKNTEYEKYLELKAKYENS